MGQSAAEIRREKLRQRSRQAVETRDQKGLGRKSVLDWSRLVGKKPMGFIPTAGKEKNLIDFLPFVVTQEWYKNLRTFSGLTTNLDVGDWDYKLEIPVHQNVGDDNDVFICNRLAFGQKCPRCEEMFAEYEKDDPDEKKIKDLKPSWRCWYNTYDYSEENNPDGVNSVWEDVSYYNFEKEILNEADEGEETVLYSDIELGKSVEIKGKEKQLGKNKFIEAGSVEFKDRDAYDESIVEETISFDALVKLCTYEEFLNAHLGLDEDGEAKSESGEPEKTEEEAPPASGRRRRAAKGQEPKEVDKDSECPVGREYGTDCDPNADECGKCDEDKFKACADRLEEIEKAAEKVEKTEPDPKAAPGRRRRRK